MVLFADTPFHLFDAVFFNFNLVVVVKKRIIEETQVPQVKRVYVECTMSIVFSFCLVYES